MQGRESPIDERKKEIGESLDKRSLKNSRETIDDLPLKKEIYKSIILCKPKRSAFKSQLFQSSTGTLP